MRFWFTLNQRCNNCNYYTQLTELQQSYCFNKSAVHLKAPALIQTNFP